MMIHQLGFLLRKDTEDGVGENRPFYVENNFAKSIFKGQKKGWLKNCQNAYGNRKAVNFRVRNFWHPDPD